MPNLEGPVWNSRSITYAFAEYNYSDDRAAPFSSMLTETVKSIVTTALANINAAVHGMLVFQNVRDTADSSVAPMIRFGFGTFGASSSTLGQATYASYGASFARGVIVRLEDPAELGFTSGPNGPLKFANSDATVLQVTTHEILHALGFAHSTDPTSIMYPYLTAQNRGITSGDIAMIQSIYLVSGTEKSDLSPYEQQTPIGIYHPIYAVASTHPFNANRTGTVPLSTPGAPTTPVSPTPPVGTVPANPPVQPIVGLVNGTTGQSSAIVMGSSGAGGPSYLQWLYIYSGSDSVALSTATQNVFLRGGSGNDAIQVASGQNVLDGGTGSNFMTGGSGTDTFFTDARGAAVVWNTLRNFHAGDAATLWGFTPGVSSFSWDSAVSGAAGSTGATLRANIVGGAGRTGDGVDASITFAGLSVEQAKGLQIATGTQAAGNYLYIYNPGV